MDINTLPIQTNVAAESTKSTPKSDASASAENGSFSDKLQQANNKPTDTDKPKSKPEEQAPQEKVVQTDKKDTETNTQENDAPQANSLLTALLGQIQLAEKNTKTPAIESTKKVDLSQTDNAPELNAATLAASAVQGMQQQTTAITTSAQNSDAAPTEKTLNIPAHLLTNMAQKQGINAQKAASTIATDGQETTQAALNLAVAAVNTSTKPSLNNAISFKSDNELATAITAPTELNNAAPQLINNSAQNIQNSLASLKQPVLATNIGSTEWQQGLGQQVIQLHQRGEQQIELHLHPAELGPLSISLKVSDNIANVQFVSAHGQVRHAVEQALPQLRDALAEQGISLGQTSVGSQQQQQTRDEQASRSFANQQVGNLDSREIEATTQAVGNMQQPGQLSLYA